MKIWIDGDACPKVIKDVLFRAAVRSHTHLIVVSNHPVAIPPSVFITKNQVGFGFDVADQYILNNMAAGDLVITADIPLADMVISQGGTALNPRGELYSTQNVKEHLAVRNLNESLRSYQLTGGGPGKFNQKDIRNFANNLDRCIARHKKT